MPILYNGNINEIGLTGEINEYNHAVEIFIKPTVRESIKRKVAPNIVARLMTIDIRLQERDLAWIDQVVQARLGDNHAYQALQNRRLFLSELEAIERILQEIRAEEYLISAVNNSLRIHRDIIINRENGLNRTPRNKTLETIELVAAAGIVFGGLSMGTGLLLKAAGVYTASSCSAATAATSCTMTAAGNKALYWGGISFLAGGLSTATLASMVREESDTKNVKTLS